MVGVKILTFGLLTRGQIKRKIKQKGKTSDGAEHQESGSTVSDEFYIHWCFQAENLFPFTEGYAQHILATN